MTQPFPAIERLRLRLRRGAEHVHGIAPQRSLELLAPREVAP